MNRFQRLAPIFLLAMAVLFTAAGCKSSQDQSAANNQPAAQDASSDPANANLAPVSDAQSAPAPSQPSAASGGSAYRQPSQPSSQYYGDSDDNSNYGEQPVEYASEPPPPLPEYNQPSSPGDDYLWTPGYWGYESTGYYWVPGVWVQAPYQGALWTPGYWGWNHNRYAYYRGYWGPHIGYYGGINYGFGYTGIGYQGGYWNSGRFYYNRSVNNVNVNVVHNVYNNTVIVNNNNRYAYNGPGGVQVRPRPAELAALREAHAPPMTTQLQNQHAASVNRAQFAAVNQGRPADLVVARPLQADHDVHPVAPPVRTVSAPMQQRGSIQPSPGGVQPGAPNRPGANPGGQPVGRPNAVPKPAPGQSRPNPVAPRNEQPGRPPVTPNQPARPEVRPNSPSPAPHPVQPAHPGEKAAPARPEPGQRPVPHPQPQATQERPAGRPAASEPRPSQHPAPQAARPAPKETPPPKAETEKPEPRKAPEKPKPENEHPQ